MTAAVAVMKMQTKRTLRDPAAAFFTLAFGPMFVVALGLIFGNDPRAEFGGRGYLDANLVSFTAIVLAVVSFIVIPVDLVTQRASGALRRFRATPLPPLTYIAGDVAVRIVSTLVSIFAMYAIGMLVFGARPDGGFGHVVLAAALGVITFLAVGYALATVLSSPGAAQALGNIAVFPLIFLSGAAVPLAVLPADVRQVARFSPLTQLVELLQGLWQGQNWADNWEPVVVLCGLLGIAVTVATRFFRWE